MTTGYDGNIYALNNAGTQFLQVSKKGGQYVVNDLGIVKDDASNGRNSFTEMQTGFGGDMIADADHNFYVFAASGNVFKVSAKEMKAKFIGKIAGVPDNYSVNGSAVNAQEKWLSPVLRVRPCMKLICLHYRQSSFREKITCIFMIWPVNISLMIKRLQLMY